MSAERQQLTRDTRRTLGGLQHLLDITTPRIIGVQILVQQLREAIDCRQHVLEIMRHATRELAECL